MNTILEMISLIYKIDKMICKYNGEHKEEYLQITKENIARIQTAIMDYNEKIKMLKDNMNNCLRIINSLSFEVIEKLLLNDKIEKPTKEKINANCEYCGKVCTSNAGLVSHYRFCAKKNAIPDGIFDDDEPKDEMKEEVVKEVIPEAKEDVVLPKKKKSRKNKEVEIKVVAEENLDEPDYSDIIDPK